MQYNMLAVSVLSLFALSTFANPLPQIEGAGDDPTDGNVGAPGLAAADALAASKLNNAQQVDPANINNGSYWDLKGQFGPEYLPLSRGTNDMYVTNMIGIDPGQKGALSACINNFNGDWGKQQCDVMTWSLGKDAEWKDSHSCYAANKDCMLAAVNAGFGEVTCFSTHSAGFDNCKFGYSYTTPLPANKVQNPKDNPSINPPKGH